VRCIFRVFGVEAGSVYASPFLTPSILFPQQQQQQQQQPIDDNKLCTLCLGILQFRFHGEDDNNNNNNIPLLISDMVKRQGYHSHHHSFSLEISIPSIVLNNDNYLSQYIRSRPWFKDHTTTFISAKDAFNYSLLPPLQTLLGSKSTEAPFRIRLTCTLSNAHPCKRTKTGLSTFIFFFLIIHFVFPSTHIFLHFL